MIVADFRRDLRYALRSLLRTPAMTFGIVLTLALGIGATAVIFTAIDAVILRGASVADPASLVSIYSGSADGRVVTSSTSYPDYVELRDSGAMAGVAAFASISVAFDAGGTTEPVSGQVVSGNYFDILGVHPVVGRGFTPDEDRVSAPARVAVVSSVFWRQRLAGDPATVGRSVMLNGASFVVVGVAPPDFKGPIIGSAPDVWVPMALQPEVRPPSGGLRRSLGGASLLTHRAIGWLNIVGRLPEGTGLQQAAASLDVVARQRELAYPGTNAGFRFNVVPLGEGPGVRSATLPALRLLGGAVILVLLIACANVAGLLLVRAVSRRREVAVRIAIGATAPQLLRQWLTESVLLALLASVGGLFITWWGASALQGLGIPENVDLSVNTRVLAFTLAIATACGLLFGLAPALQLLKRDTVDALKGNGRASTARTSTRRMRNTFVVLQVALSLILLVGAGLFMRTLWNAYRVDLGYDVDRTLLTEVNLDTRGYAPPAGQLIYAQILERLEGLPGVQAAGAARVAVLSGAVRSTGVSTNGQPLADDGGNTLMVRTNVVSDGYLAALGVPLLRGRDFAKSDAAGGARVAIVSRSLADRLWPGRDPIGQTLVGSSAPFEVIGVVPDAVYVSAVESAPPPFFYSLLSQNYESGMTLYIRTARDPIAVFPAVRQAVREVDPLLTLSRPLLLRDLFDRSVGDQRLMARLVGVFGLLALILAAIGLYSVMAYVAADRRAEMGLRLALGAKPRSIFQLMMGEGLRLVAFGLAFGLLGAFMTAHYLTKQLFGVAPIDPTTFLVVCLALTFTGMIACFFPARRAMQANPATSLQQP